jgi:hypothetical protein
MLASQDTDHCQPSRRSANANTVQTTIPALPKNVSGFNRKASANSPRAIAARQRVLPQNGQGMPMKVRIPHWGIGSCHVTTR